jgi:phytoene synthase
MAETGDAAFTHCRQLVAQADKVRYWATFYAPEDRRHALYALYAFDLELAAIAERVREPMAGEIRLQWWREVLEGKRGEEAAANPVAAGLLTALNQRSIAPEPLLRLIEARRFDVYDEPMATIADFEKYGRATTGAIFNVAARLLGGDGKETEEICAQAGLAQAYLNAMLALGRAVRGQLYLADEALGHYGADRRAIAAGAVTSELRAALAEMRLNARRNLSAARALLPHVSRNILPVLLPAALVMPTLARMERRNYDPLRPPQLLPLGQQWLIWRAARNPERIFG